jgi:hypothetical protein
MVAAPRRGTFPGQRDTAKRWAERYRQLGEAGTLDRSSRPHRSPRGTRLKIERKIPASAAQQGPVPGYDRRPAGHAPSTVHEVLVRHSMPRPACLDLATGAPLRAPQPRRPEARGHQEARPASPRFLSQRPPAAALTCAGCGEARRALSVEVRTDHFAHPGRGCDDDSCADKGYGYGRTRWTLSGSCSYTASGRRGGLRRSGSNGPRR